MRKFSRIMLTLFVFTTFLANAQVNEELPDLNVSFQQNTYEDSAAIAAVPAPVEIRGKSTETHGTTSSANE